MGLAKERCFRPPPAPVALGGTGAKLFVELGPGTELSGMVRRTVPEAVRLNVAGPDDLAALASAINP